PVIRHSDRTTEQWARLADTVRAGRPPVSMHGTDEGAEFFAGFVDALFAMNFPAAQAAARALGERKSVVDVGAGSAVWSLAFATAYPSTRVKAIDHPTVLDRVTRVFAERMGVADRVECVPADMRTADFGTGHDLAVLGHILHGEGPAHSLNLLKRLHGSLAPGGSVLVAEMIPDDDRNKDLFGLFFGVNMLALTEDGCVFTRSELDSLAGQAGFSCVEWVEAPAPYPLAVFHK
ncbi:MAG: methyltransferase, partial [Candidatus Eremiobacterota bacterium]